MNDSMIPLFNKIDFEIGFFFSLVLFIKELRY